MPTPSKPASTTGDEIAAPAWSSELCVVTATRLETWAARRVLGRDAEVTRLGVGLSEHCSKLAGPVVSCGLAGALSPELRPGTIMIPETVGLVTGEILSCDDDLVTALIAAARTLGHEPITAPLLTAPHLITGAARANWARRGLVAVDMESGPLLQQQRGAVVRVILDTTERDLAAEWETPWRALTTPRLWPEAGRLALAAPRYALLAARVIHAAIAP